ncbi:MAG: hypothetical protein ACPIOQ_02520 [Promethearchaeia archaeon]
MPNRESSSLPPKKQKGLLSLAASSIRSLVGKNEEESYLIYITKRLIIAPVTVGIADTRAVEQHNKKLAASAKYLDRDHCKDGVQHYLVWNMTRPDKGLCKPDLFGNQVLDVTKFPLYVPTLQFTFDFCNMIRYWLKQDQLNVAVILYEDAHTQPPVDPVRMAINDESRIAYLVSAFLSYSGEFKATFDALDHVTECVADSRRSEESATEVAVPSQSLYYRYIDDIRNRGFSNTDAIMLDCIFVHTIPLLVDGGNCRPVLEITCNGTPVRLDERYTNIRHPKYSDFAPKDEIMVFEALGATIWGDVVITCYHANMGYVQEEAQKIEQRERAGGKRRAAHLPVFRICFHVGFLQPGGQMQRLKKEDLDFACEAPHSTRDVSADGMALLPDFSVDLIFQKPDSAKALVQEGGEGHVLDEFIFPSDFAGLTHISQMHVVEPHPPYISLMKEYERWQQEEDPRRRAVSEIVRGWALKRCNNLMDPAIAMLDKMPSLQDELVPIDDRLYILGFPWKHGRTPVNEGMNNALKQLQEEMGGKFLVWNLSGEDKFDYVKFQHQVINWDLGEGMPGLNKMLKICHTMRYWLRACLDRECVLVLLVNELEDPAKARQLVLSGKARASLVYACFRALDDFHRDLADFGADGDVRLDLKKKTSVSQTLFEFGRKRNLKETDMEEILEVPSFKRLAFDFDRNINNGPQNALPVVLMRIFVQRRDGGQGVRNLRGEAGTVQASIPIFGESLAEDNSVTRGCRPIIEILNQGQVVYSSLLQPTVPAFLDEKEHDVMSFTLTKEDGTQGVSLLGDVMITCSHVELKPGLPGTSGGQTHTHFDPRGGYAEGSVDRKIIFRYCFHTGFVDAQPFRLHASELDMLPASLLPTGASVPDDLIVDFVLGPSADGGTADEELSLSPKYETCLLDMSALHAVDADPAKVACVRRAEAPHSLCVCLL